MEIKDLNAKQGNVDIVVDVVEIGETREFQKFGNTGKVTNAKVKDQTGEIKLTLWNEQRDNIKVGDNSIIETGTMTRLMGGDVFTPLVNSFPEHPVNEGFDSACFFPMSSTAFITWRSSTS